VRRHLAAGLALAAVLLGPIMGAVLTAGPANADNGTSNVGCSTGDSCEILLKSMVTVAGANYDEGANNTVVDITPPPCLWEPLGDTIKGSQYIVGLEGDDPAQATTLFQVNDAVKQAVGFLKDPANAPVGTWYQLPVNPAASAAGRAECLQLPLYKWVAPGQPLPGIHLPPATLAQLALSKMRLPKAGTMTLNPADGTTYTNLPTYLAVTLTPGYQEIHGGAQDGMPYTTTYAYLKTDPGDAATVWATPSKLNVSASGGGQYTMATGGCGYLGSKEITTPAADNAGPGTTPDCGATFQSPASWELNATMTWTACWAPGVQTGAPPADCQPVAGAQLDPLIWQHRVLVDEIQSVDNGQGNG
jgi:hypothetical protein